MPKVRTVVTEDEFLIAKDLKARLQRMGHDVAAVVSSGPAAIAAVAEHQPDLVLMDIVIRGEMDGIEAAERIREKHCIPVIFVTAHADRNRLERAKLVLPFGYILKPFDDRTIRIAVEMALCMSQADARRREADEALRRNEARTRSILQVAPIGIGVMRNRVFVEVNDRLCEMVGYSSEELLGRDARILYPDEEEYDFVGREKYGQISRLGWGSVETRWQTKDGRILEILLNSAFIDKNSPGEGVTFTALDITAQKRAVETLERERRRLFNFLDDLPAMVYVQASDHSIRFANRYFRDLYGDPAGRACYEVMHGFSRPCEECPTFEVFRTGLPVEWKYKDPEGRVFLIYDYPFTDLDGAPVVLELAIDVTAVKGSDAVRIKESVRQELQSKQ